MSAHTGYDPEHPTLLQRIIRLSADNRWLVMAATAVLLAMSFWTMRNIPLDALPDLSDTQVIVYSKWDRSPDIVEDQVTYPIVTALLGAPKVKAVRALSDFGYSYVYVIFEDGTDIYWARSRTLEYLSKITSSLPPGVQTSLGPDATSVGWVYQYALVDHSGKHSLDELRSLQDWFLRYGIQSTPGVAEVATVGGQVRQFQVQVNPNKLASYGISIEAVIGAVKSANAEVGGRLVEYRWAGTHGPGAWVCEDHPGLRAGGAQGPERHCCAVGRGGHRVPRPRTATRARRPGWPGGCGERHRHHAPGRKRPERD